MSAVREAGGSFTFAKKVVRLLGLKGPKCYDTQAPPVHSTAAKALVQTPVLALGCLSLGRAFMSKRAVPARRAEVHTPGPIRSVLGVNSAPRRWAAYSQDDPLRQTPPGPWLFSNANPIFSLRLLSPNKQQDLHGSSDARPHPASRRGSHCVDLLMVQTEGCRLGEACGGHTRHFPQDPARLPGRGGFGTACGKLAGTIPAHVFLSFQVIPGKSAKPHAFKARTIFCVLQWRRVTLLAPQACSRFTSRLWLKSFTSSSSSLLGDMLMMQGRSSGQNSGSISSKS